MRFVFLGVALALLAIPASAMSENDSRLDPDKPEDAILIQQKMSCSLNEGETITYYAKGGTFSRVPGERDRHLFNWSLMGIRQCANFEDPERGHGYLSVHKEILLYLDPETNEILRTWENPWTDDVVEVIHVANDPVNMRAPTYAYGEDGTPFKLGAPFNIGGTEISTEFTWMNGRVMTALEVPLFYKNPLGGEFQKNIGGTYHAMEAFQDFYLEEDLLDASKPTLEAHNISWFRFSQFLPWMEMGGRTGMLFFTGSGGRIGGIEDLPQFYQDEIAKSYPGYVVPPPLDDARPNVTSWSYFKKVLEERQAEEQNDKGEAQ